MQNTAIIKVEKLSEGPCADSMRGTCAIVCTYIHHVVFSQIRQGTGTPPPLKNIKHSLEKEMIICVQYI
jgi:hypothetical protein